MPAADLSRSIISFAADFDRASLQPDFQKAEAERRQIAERFPLDGLAELDLEAYATGDGEDYSNTLAGLLTRGTPVLGNILLVGWMHVGIYKNKAGLFKSHLEQTGDARQDWALLRASLLECTHLAESGKWFEIDKVPLTRRIPAVRTKMLYVYWPTEVLPIYISRHLAHYLKALGMGEMPRSGAHAATPNRQLLDYLRKFPELNAWHPWELAQLLDAWSPARAASFDLNRPRQNSQPDTMKPTASLNQILYGPPGTGKTWQVIRTAASLLSGKHLPEEEAKKRYDELVHEGRIRLATFHQSFAYEDFIEGIRPVMKNEETAGFEVRDGIFKDIAVSALFACLAPIGKRAKSNEDFEMRWTMLINHIRDSGDELKIVGLKGVEWVLSETEKGNIAALNCSSKKNAYCGKSHLAEIWPKLQGFPTVTSTQVVNAYGKGSHSGVIAAIFNYMQSITPEERRNPSVMETRELIFPTTTDPSSVVQQYLSEGPASGWQLRADG